MVTVPASEFQRDPEQWYEKLRQAPVEITQGGERAAYLVSPEMFDDLWQRRHLSLAVEMLSETDVDLIMGATVETDRPYRLADIPELDPTADRAAKRP